MTTRRQGFVGLIAEVKRRSPSRGPINLNLDPGHLASEYAKSSVAVGISVLTDADKFGGSPEDLAAVRQAVGSDFAILRKDFLSVREDIDASVAMGANAVLLIVSDLGDRLADLHAYAMERGVEALVEVRTMEEIGVAVAAGAKMIAVNQRGDPKSPDMTVDCEKAVRLAPYLPEGIVKVAASGIGVPGGTDMAEIAEAGYHAALVGEALVTAEDPYERARQLAGV